MEKYTVHSKICSELTELYKRKNHDYGDSFGKSFIEYGMSMPCIRLEDKLNRLKSLTRKDAEVMDESIDDTLMDLANYAIMTLVERQMDLICIKHKKVRYFPICDECAKCDDFDPNVGYNHPHCVTCENKSGIVKREVEY